MFLVQVQWFLFWADRGSPYKKPIVADFEQFKKKRGADRIRGGFVLPKIWCLLVWARRRYVWSSLSLRRWLRERTRPHDLVILRNSLVPIGDSKRQWNV